MRIRYVYDLREQGIPGNIGNKADSLRFLADKGFAMPATHVCTWDAHEANAQDDTLLVNGLSTGWDTAAMRNGVLACLLLTLVTYALAAGALQVRIRRT
jgi:hypothetical protein